eukprot:353876-Chlamydomonas_euryale.AAC.3
MRGRAQSPARDLAPVQLDSRGASAEADIDTHDAAPVEAGPASDRVVGHGGCAGRLASVASERLGLSSGQPPCRARGRCVCVCQSRP